MAEIKRKLEQLSEWVEYTLDSTLLEPPTLRVRLRPLDAFDVADSFTQSSGSLIYGRALLEQALHAVVETDLTENGQPIVLSDKNKEAVLRPLLTERVVGGQMLAFAIVDDAKRRERFLKN